MAGWKPILPIPPSAGTPDLETILNVAVLDKHEIYDVQARLLGYIAVTNTDIVPVQYGLNGSATPAWERRSWSDGGTFINMAAEWAKREGLIFEPPPKTEWSGDALALAEFPDIKWAIPELIPEGLTILAGRAKSGKSWLALNIAVAVGLGDKALGNIECQKGDVLVLSLEDPPRRLAQRIKAVLQGREGPRNVEFFPAWPRMGDGGIEDIERWLAHHKSARMVVIDLWVRFCPERERGADIYREDYKALMPLKTLADKHHVAVVLLHHENKMGQIGGTVAMSGTPDTILTLKREKGDKHGILGVEGREVEGDDLALEFDGQTGTWIKLGSEADFRETEQRRQVLKALADFPQGVAPGPLAEHLGIKAVTMRSKLKRLLDSGKIVKYANGLYGLP